MREYLLEKWHRCCAYCGKEGVPLQIEHLTPHSRGGSNRVSNLTLACRPCNQKKGNRTAAEFGHPELQAKAKAPLKDAAAVNAARYTIGNAIRATGLSTSFWSGGRTKRNRIAQGYQKDHWIDAVCVGASGESVFLNGVKPLTITARGHGHRQVVRTDRYGFPRGAPGRVKRPYDFQTGDIAKLRVPKGKYAGTHFGRIAGIRADGRFDLNKITSRWVNFTLIQRGDGYAYA